MATANTWVGSLDRAIRVQVGQIDGISIGNATNKDTWKVFPSHLQTAAQPVIDAFNPDDPAHATAELDAQVKLALDTERLAAAIIWTILKQLYPADTNAQTKTKFGVVRQGIIDVYKARPWVA